MANFIKKNLLDDFIPNFIHVEFEHELEPGDLGQRHKKTWSLSCTGVKMGKRIFNLTSLNHT